MCQSITIKGKIINENNEPVPSATILHLRTGQKMFSDKNGEFTIPQTFLNDSIQVSAVGYQSVTEPNNERGLITIILRKEITELAAVQLYTGYQQLPKERATGSFAAIDNKLFNRTVSTDMLSRLQGLAPGLLFDKNSGNNIGITIRGISTLFASTQPLLVVDNFPFYGSVNNINPNDIESITILKDAAAASVWGAAAGNGVIVITTKKAVFSKPLSVIISSNTTTTQKPDYFYYPALSAASFIEAETFLFQQGYFNAAINNTTTRPVLSPVVEILLQQRNGTISAATAATRIDSLSRFDIRQDMQRHLYQSGVNTQHSLALQGGSPLASYYLGLGYDKNKSTSVGNEYSRYTISVKNNLRPLKKLLLQSSINFTQSQTLNNQLGSLSPGGGKSALYPYARLSDDAGNYLAVPKDYRMAYIDTAGAGRLLEWYYRPLQELQLADNTFRLQDITAQLSVRYDFTPQFSTELRYQYGRQLTGTENYNSPETYFTRNLVNRYTQINGNTIKYNLPLGGILNTSGAELQTQNTRAQFNFDNTWNKHQLVALAGAELREVVAQSSGYRVYGFNPDVLTATNTDYATAYPIYGNLASAQRIPAALSFGGTINRFTSLFANAAYTYFKKYTLSASARKDAANIFGASTNRKGLPLWSIGAGWNIADENFYHLTALPQLRLRVTYGFNGNADNNRSALTTIEYTGADPLTNLPFANINNMPNAELRWEKTGTLNIGIDFSALHERISGSLEFYTKRSVDLLGSAPVDRTLGFTSQIVNSANVNGRGVELQLATINTMGRISWSTNFMFNFSRNKIARYLQPVSTARNYAGFGNTLNPIEGSDAYGLYSYNWAGLDPANGDPQVFLDGNISKNYTAIRNAPLSSLHYHGSSIPLYFGSIRNTISWKKLSLSALVLFKFKYWFRKRSVNYTSLAASWISHPDYDKRWKKTGDENFTSIPSFTYPLNSVRDEMYTYSTVTVIRGDHIRLKDIRLDYNIVTKNKSLLKNATVFLYADNIGILWKKNNAGIDPDYFTSDLPAPRSIAAGFKIIF